MKLKNKVALVTGASSGIGEQMCYQLAQKGVDIILVARNETDLKKVAKNCEKLSVKTFVEPLDLTENNFSSLEKYDIDILINNAGFGYAGKFVDMDQKKVIDMINLNILALTNLTYIFSKKMKSGSYIVNVASTAAFQPGPGMAEYFATKAYVLSFSQALFSELKGKIHVCCLCPGQTKTQFDKVANMKFSGSVMSAESVAKQAIDGMLAKKDLVIPGTTNKIVQIFSKLLPRKLVLKVVEKIDFTK